MGTYDYQWRGRFTNDELNAIHADAFNHPLEGHDWAGQVDRHSLGWVTAREDRELVGFVNVPWDGGSHAFILDAIVVARRRRQGIGTRLIELATREACAAGCEHLHVDFTEEHRAFYLGSCGFTPTPAGLVRLPPGGEGSGATVVHTNIRHER